MFNSTGNNFGAGSIQFKDYQAENYVVLNAKFSYDPTNAAYQGVDTLEIYVPDLSINRSAVAGAILTFQDRYVYSSYTWNNDANTPLVTTYQTGKDLNSAWAVVKDGDYYYLIHILTGTYMAVNDGVGTNSNRRRLHMESTNTPGDIHRFKITSHSGSPLPYSINPKNVTSGHMYLNPSNGNKPAYYAIQTSDGGYQDYKFAVGAFDLDDTALRNLDWQETPPAVTAQAPCLYMATKWVD